MPAAARLAAWGALSVDAAKGPSSSLRIPILYPFFGFWQVKIQFTLGCARDARTPGGETEIFRQGQALGLLRIRGFWGANQTEAY